MTINGVPLLTLWINKINKVFNSEVYINTHYLSEIVSEYIIKNHNQVKIIYEPKLMGTAGTIFNNKKIFHSDDLLVIHADNYSEDNLFEFSKIVQKNVINNIPVMMAFKTEHPKECGIIKIDDNNKLIEFIEKPENPKSNLANCGIYFFPKQFISELLLKNPFRFDLSTEVIPDLVNKAEVYITKKKYIDIGTPEKYELVR